MIFREIVFCFEKKKREVDHFFNLMAGAASEILRKFFKEKEGVKQSWYKIFRMGNETLKNCESK